MNPLYFKNRMAVNWLSHYYTIIIFDVRIVLCCLIQRAMCMLYKTLQDAIQCAIHLLIYSCIPEVVARAVFYLLTPTKPLPVLTCTCTCTMMDLLSSAACNVHIFPEVVQPVFKQVDGRRIHDMLREFIPCVDHSLAEEVLSDIQV